MNIRKYIRQCVIIFIWLKATMVPLHAQEMKIGDRVRETILGNVINYSTDSLKFSDIGKKLIILDFWQTGCLSCIQAFPKIDSLQKAFNNEIQFVLVTPESKDSIERFLKRYKKIKLPSIPCITGDSILGRMFPHISVPHHVWLDSGLIVKYITSGYNTTSRSIRQFIEGKSPLLALKNDTLLPNISASDIWVALHAENQERLEFYSHITKYFQGVPGGGGITSTVKGGPDNTITCHFASIVELYKTAYSQKRFDFSAANSIILNVSDSYAYTFPEDHSYLDLWLAENSYNYKLIVPVEKASDLYKIMQQDLARYFSVEARVEKRKIKCFVLEKTSTKDKLHTKGGKSKTNLFLDDNDSMKYLINLPFERFAVSLRMILKNTQSQYPFIDATGYTKNVDLFIKVEVLREFDLQALKNQLKKYDLDIVIKDYVTDVLVINEKKKERIGKAAAL